MAKDGIVTSPNDRWESWRRQRPDPHLFTKGLSEHLLEDRRADFVHIGETLGKMAEYVGRSYVAVELFDESQEDYRRRDQVERVQESWYREKCFGRMQAAGRELAMTLKDFGEAQKYCRQLVTSLALNQFGYDENMAEQASAYFQRAFPEAEPVRHAFSHPSKPYRTAYQLAATSLVPGSLRIGTMIRGDVVSVWDRNGEKAISVNYSTVQCLIDVLHREMNALKPMIHKLAGTNRSGWLLNLLDPTAERWP